MFKRISLITFLLLLASPVVSAQGTITSGAANYVHTASHWDTSPEANFTGAGTGDQLFESGWWFRIEGDTAETVFTAPTTLNYTGTTATLNWTDLGTRGLGVVKTVVISSAAAGSAEVVTRMTVTNNSAATITLHLFNMADLDVNGSAATDSAILVSPTQVTVSDATAGSCTYRAPGAVGVIALPFAAATDVAAQLSNTTVTNFTSSGFPFGPGDFTGGFQYTATLAAGASTTAALHIACNQPSTPVTLTGFSID